MNNSLNWSLFTLFLLIWTSATAQQLLPNSLAEQQIHHLIRERHIPEVALSDLQLTSASYSRQSGMSHFYFQQYHQQIAIEQAELQLHFDRQGQLQSFHANLQNLNNQAFSSSIHLAPDNQIASAILAVKAVFQHLHIPNTSTPKLKQRLSKKQTYLFEKLPSILEDISATLVWHHHNNQMILAWKIDIQTDATHWWHLHVHAKTQEILHQHNAMLNCRFHPFGKSATAASPNTLQPHFQMLPPTPSSYHVFEAPLENPMEGSRSLVTMAADSLASPFGWHDTNGHQGAEFTITRGNNVFAQTDELGLNLPGFAPDGGPNLSFDFPLQLPDDPANFKAAAVTNLFYWCNYMHDFSYQYGFDEQAGNFQHNNYDKGGVENDFLYADAQDAGSTNNANFRCGPDGQRPRMQLFLWDKHLFASPFSVSGNEIAAEVAQFTPLSVSEGPLFYVESAPLACEPLPLPHPVNGKIVLVDRGNCTFTQKVNHVQQAGALACIVCNNNDQPPFAMGGDSTNISIPALMIGKSDCDLLKAQLAQNDSLLAQISNPSDNFLIDSDFDNAVIAHEYAHGISIRLTGGAGTASCLKNEEQMGEGWSDFIALMATMKPSDSAEKARSIGTYILHESADGPGLRPMLYSPDMSINDATYDDIKVLSAPHGLGFVWCTMLWEMTWALIDEHGMETGFDLAMQLVVEGMKLQACRPGFVDARDAILLADEQITGGDNQALIWQAFAKRGLGYSAQQGSSENKNDGTEAFDLPPCLLPTAQCQDITVYLDQYGQAFITPDLLDNGSFSCTGNLDFSVEGEAYYFLSCADIGHTQLALEVTDEAGNTNSCYSNIEVKDTIAPFPICDQIRINLSETNAIFAEQLAQQSIDNCSPKEDFEYSFEELFFTLDQLGKNQIIISISDAFGNTDSCTATIHVALGNLPITNGTPQMRTNLDHNRLVLFPNPANHTLYIKVNQPTAPQIHIYNQQGQSVLPPIRFSGQETQINIASLPPGVYWIQLSDQQDCHKQKLVVY